LKRGGRRASSKKISRFCTIPVAIASEKATPVGICNHRVSTVGFPAGRGVFPGRGGAGGGRDGPPPGRPMKNSRRIFFPPPQGS